MFSSEAVIEEKYYTRWMMGNERTGPAFGFASQMPGQDMLLDFERFVFLLGTTTTTDD
jgi:hypothetical protein